MPRIRKSRAPRLHTAVQSSLPSPTPATHDPPTTTPRALPANWPLHLTYLTRPIYSPTLTLSELTALHTPPSNQSSSSACFHFSPVLTSTPYPPISIQPITSPPTHPAFNQHALFATQSLPPRSFICDYTSSIHPSRPLPSPPHSSTPATTPAAHTNTEQNHQANIAPPDSAHPATTLIALEPATPAAAASSAHDLSPHRHLGISINALHLRKRREMHQTTTAACAPRPTLHSKTTG